VYCVYSRISCQLKTIESLKQLRTCLNKSGFLVAHWDHRIESTEYIAMSGSIKKSITGKTSMSILLLFVLCFIDINIRIFDSAKWWVYIFDCSIWLEADQQAFDLHDNDDRAQGDLDMQDFDGRSDAFLSSINNVSHDTHQDNSGVGDDNDDEPQYQQSETVQFIPTPSDSHLNRSEDAWDNIHNENVLHVRPHAHYNRGRPPERHEPGWEDMLSNIKILTGRNAKTYDDIKMCRNWYNILLSV